MKTISVLLFFLLISFYSAVAQDIITLKSGDELKCKILRLNPKDVSFMPAGVADTLCISRNDVIKLRYQDGTLINLDDVRKMPESYENTFDSMYYAGITDATKYYKDYKSASTGVLVSGLIFPFNIIPAVICSSTSPNEQNLGYTDPQLMKDPGYNNGYKKQAHKIKKKKVWTNYAIGSGAMIGFYILVNALIVTTMVY